jgi:hypothetical protein
MAGPPIRTGQRFIAAGPSRTFLDKKKGQVHLAGLPGYSPERPAAAAEPGRAPVEPIDAEADKSSVPNLNDLVEVVVSKVEQIQNDVELLTSFFPKKEVAFFID